MEALGVRSGAGAGRRPSYRHVIPPGDAPITRVLTKADAEARRN